MKVQIRRRIIIALGGVIALLALVYGFWPKPVLVETAEAVRGPFRVTIEEEGKTRVKDRFICSAPVAGFLRRIELEAGDAVQKGGPLLSSNRCDPRFLIHGAGRKPSPPFRRHRQQSGRRRSGSCRQKPMPISQTDDTSDSNAFLPEELSQKISSTRPKHRPNRQRLPISLLRRHRLSRARN